MQSLVQLQCSACSSAKGREPPSVCCACRCLGAAPGFGLKLGKARVDCLEELRRAPLLAPKLGVEADHLSAERLHHVKARCRRQPRGRPCALQLAHLHRESRDRVGNLVVALGDLSGHLVELRAQLEVSLGPFIVYTTKV